MPMVDKSWFVAVMVMCVVLDSWVKEEEDADHDCND